ncbi:MAG: hypothetical protein WA101_02375 [Minisyncoccia bacterium]
MKKSIVLFVFFAIAINYNVSAQEDKSSITTLVIYELPDSATLFPDAFYAIPHYLKLLTNDTIFIDENNQAFMGKICMVSPEYKVEFLQKNVGDPFYWWENKKESKMSYKYFIMSPDIYIKDTDGKKHHLIRPFEWESSEKPSLSSLSAALYSFELSMCQLEASSQGVFTKK